VANVPSPTLTQLFLSDLVRLGSLEIDGEDVVTRVDNHAHLWLQLGSHVHFAKHLLSISMLPNPIGCNRARNSSSDVSS
jgi:hypothetical protein